MPISYVTTEDNVVHVYHGSRGGAFAARILCAKVRDAVLKLRRTAGPIVVYHEISEPGILTQAYAKGFGLLGRELTRLAGAGRIAYVVHAPAAADRELARFAGLAGGVLIHVFDNPVAAEAEVGRRRGQGAMATAA